MQKQLSILGAVVALSLSSAAFAGHQIEDDSVYLGVSLGGTSMLDKNDVVGATSVDDSGTGWKIFGGVKFTPNVAVEASYTDFGKASATDGVDTLDVNGRSVALTLVGTIPLNHQFSLFGKAGASFWKGEADWNGAKLGDNDGTDWVYGVGASYNVTKDFTVRAEWERYANVGEDDSFGIHGTDVDMWSVGAQYNF